MANTWDKYCNQLGFIWFRREL